MTQAATSELKDLYPVGEQPPVGHVPSHMYAWLIRPQRFGEPNKAFQIEVVDTPSIADDEVLVYVMAAGVNYNNVWAGLGVPINVIEARQKAGEKEDFHIGGSDASGIVYKVGKKVKNVKVGDEVVIHCGTWDQDAPEVQAGNDPMFSPSFRIWGYETNYGSFAQFSRAQDHQCLPKPKHLSWEGAAAYMLVGATAYRMLYGWGEHALRREDVVLVWGGAGGLGSMAIQVCAAAGAKAVAVVSDDDKFDYCTSLGAVGCINRKHFEHWGMLPHWKDAVGYAEWLKGVRKFGKAIWDVLGERRSPRLVFEHPGESTIPTSIFVCDSGGMVVICAGTTGYNATVDLRYLWMRQKRLQGSHFANDSQAKGINDLVIAGKVDPCLSRTFTWAELPLAHQLMYENKHPYGNMAILIGAPAEGSGISATEPVAHVEPAAVPAARRDFYRAPLHELEEPAAVQLGPLDARTVRELMHYGAITVSAATSVDEVARRMASYRIHAIVVVDEAGYAIGLVSQTDIVLARQGRTPEQLITLTAGDVMTKRLITCRPNARVSEAITLMTRNRIHRLVVADERQGKLWPIGILSMTDIINYGLETPPAPAEGGAGGLGMLADIYEPTPPRPSKMAPPAPRLGPGVSPDLSTVNEVMHHGVVSCHPETSLSEVAHRLLSNRISAVVVVDGEGYLVGLVSQTDVVLARQGRSPEQLAALTAADILTANVITSTADMPLNQAITLMTRNRIHRLVVTEMRDNRPWPIGVVSMTDIVRQTLGGEEQAEDGGVMSFFGVDPI